MTKSDDGQTSDEQVAAIASEAGPCPDCGDQPTRVAARYPSKATVVCDRGHQWEVEIAETPA